jgi:hypothetical protein
LRKYLEAANDLDLDTGKALYNNFRQTLRSAAKDDWDLIIANIPNCTPILFFTAIEEWKRELILLSAQQTMSDYLETLTKSQNMTVESFINRLKVMICYINDIPFPGPDPPSINTTKFKNIIFSSIGVNDISTTSVLQIQQFMHQER